MWALVFCHPWRVKIAWGSKRPNFLQRVLWRLLGCRFVQEDFEWGASFRGGDAISEEEG